MKVFAKVLFLLAGLGSSITCGQRQPATRLQSHPATATSFQHIVLIMQENRTPDNLFQGLCSTPTKCSTTPTASQYNIQTGDWKTKGGVIQPGTVMLASAYDLSHTHSAWVAQCDLDTATNKCRMDGAADVPCSRRRICPPNPQFKFVDNSTGILNPYLTLATSYGWANYMFQTNQGPSFPAHQFIFGATSAPSSDEDHKGTYASENVSGPGTGAGAGCVAQQDVRVQLINSNGTEERNNKIYPCFEHDTVPDLNRITSWRYYAPGQGSIWTAPNAILHICQPVKGKCEGMEWKDNVDAKNPADFLTDVSSPNCKLKQVTWVIPTAANSDHAGENRGHGPSWVASLVNAIGNNRCKNPDGTSFWDTTAIFITWDDWGGWYDHEGPTILESPFGGYQLGFRVPLIVVSALTSPGLINNSRYDFGSIVRFIEQNFGITEGKLTFADKRAMTDFTVFFDLKSARKFVTIPGGQSVATFLAQPVVGPDNDDD